MKPDPHIFIIEDHDIVAAALSMVLLESFPKAHFQRVGSFPKATELLEAGPSVDLVILDMDIPGGQSYLMVQTLRTIQPGIRILIFTGKEEENHAIRFLKAGANGFLSKNAPLEDCTLAVRMILNDKKYVSEAVQQLITNSLHKKPLIYAGEGASALSKREAEVTELLIQGKWTKEIAKVLNLNPTTVSTHKAKIFQKMGVSNVIDLFKKLNQVGPG